MDAIILQLFTIFTPMVQAAISRYKATHNGAEPTDADIIATFKANTDAILADGAAWRAGHPDV